MKDGKDDKAKNFEKESLENDFLLVKASDKKPGKIISKGKPIAAKLDLSGKASVGNEEKVMLLSDLLGLHLKPKQDENAKDELKNRLEGLNWNYLDS